MQTYKQQEMKTLSLSIIITFGIISNLLSQIADPVKSWKFDSDPANIEGNYRLVNGVEAKALKLDGFTTLISEKADV